MGELTPALDARVRSAIWDVPDFPKPGIVFKDITPVLADGRLELKNPIEGRVTFHDSCNPARGMGMFEEPRYVIKNVCKNFYDMPANTIREPEHSA